MSEEQKKEEEEQHYEMIKVNNPQRQIVPKDTRNNYPINFLINLIQIIILCHYGLNDIPGCDNRLKDYMHTLAIYHILLFLYPLIILGIIIFVYCAGGNREGLARIHYIYTVIFIVSGFFITVRAFFVYRSVDKVQDSCGWLSFWFFMYVLFNSVYLIICTIVFFLAVGLFYLSRLLRKNDNNNENEEGKEMNEQQE